MSNKNEGPCPTFNICKLQVKAGDSNTTRLRNHQITLETRRDMKRLSASSTTLLLAMMIHPIIINNNNYLLLDNTFFTAANINQSKCRLDSKNKCRKDIIMATAEYIDNDLRLLDSMDDLEFILHKIIIIIIINTSFSAAARQLMSVMSLGSAGNLISAERSCILLETVDMFLVFLHNNYWSFLGIVVCLTIYVACWLAVYWEPVGN